MSGEQINILGKRASKKIVMYVLVGAAFVTGALMLATSGGDKPAKTDKPTDAPRQATGQAVDFTALERTKQQQQQQMRAASAPVAATPPANGVPFSGPSLAGDLAGTPLPAGNVDQVSLSQMERTRQAAFGLGGPSQASLAESGMVDTEDPKFFEAYDEFMVAAARGSASADKPATPSREDGAQPDLNAERERLVREAMGGQANPAADQNRQREQIMALLRSQSSTATPKLPVRAPSRGGDSPEEWTSDKAMEAMHESDAIMPTVVKSRFILMEGSVIPVVLESDINSELPGRIIARVVSNTYDSLDGTRLLIPAGARLIGESKSEVGKGSDRLVVIFRRIILSDGRSIRIPAMPATDRLGAAGVPGVVDNRWFKMLAPSFMVAAIARLTLPKTQPQSTSVTNNYGSMPQGNGWMDITGKIFRDTSDKVLGRYDGMGPIIRISRGTQMNVMVTGDIIIPSMDEMARRKKLDEKAGQK